MHCRKKMFFTFSYSICAQCSWFGAELTPEMKSGWHAQHNALRFLHLRFKAVSLSNRPIPKSPVYAISLYITKRGWQPKYSRAISKLLCWFSGWNDACHGTNYHLKGGGAPIYDKLPWQNYMQTNSIYNHNREKALALFCKILWKLIFLCNCYRYVFSFDSMLVHFLCPLVNVWRNISFFVGGCALLCFSWQSIECTHYSNTHAHVSNKVYVVVVGSWLKYPISVGSLQ